MTDKTVQRIQQTRDRHWVGDGFPVRTLFAYPGTGQELSPFLMLDHAGPADFPPAEGRRGVGEHPHRGFETVTIVYDGQVEHRDSAGGGGIIGPGDVQWMTAASGLVHEEFHGPDFARSGGRFEMAQLWVNLPTAHKMAPPRYQGIEAKDIPELALSGDGGQARIIAGSYQGITGPALTYSPMLMADLRLAGEGSTAVSVDEGWNALVVVLRGSVQVNGSQALGEDTVAVLGRSGSGITLTADGPAVVLLLAGDPLDEPIAGSGPFVMNTQGELRQAMIDFQAGRMGRLGSSSK